MAAIHPIKRGRKGAGNAERVPEMQGDHWRTAPHPVRQFASAWPRLWSEDGCYHCGTQLVDEAAGPAAPILGGRGSPLAPPTAAVPQDKKWIEADAALRIDLASEEDLARAAAGLQIGELETGSQSRSQILAEWTDAKCLVIRAPIDPTRELDVHVEWFAGFVSRNADAIRAMRPARISVLSALATASDQATTSIAARPLRTLVEMEIPVQFEPRLV
jgi:hypothetical protein